MRRRAWPHFMIAMSIVLLTTGCASTQLNYNTLEISDTIDSILTKQVLANLRRFIANPYAIPSMTTLSSGTFTTTNSITPTFSDPLSNTVATTNTLTKIIGGTTTTTGSVVGTTTGKGLSVAANDQWMQQWLTNPIIENHILRRLRALYRFATNPQMTRDQLICEYAIVTLSSPGKTYSIPCDKLGYVSKTGTTITPDPDFITRPGCVICEPLEAGSGRLVVNEQLRHGWLRYAALPFSDSTAAYSLGIYDGYLLYLGTPESIQDFYNFILFVQEATVEQSPSASSSVSGSGKKTTRETTKPAIVPDASTGRSILVEPPKNVR